MKPKATGSLIVFEGIDGTGKSTQIELLSKALREKGFEVITSQEPTAGPFGQKLRQSMVEGRLSREEELSLFHEDRRLHVQELLNPALDQGKVILLDRYYFSTMAYQGARGFDPIEIRQTNEAFAPTPNLLIIMSLSAETALDRIGARDGSGNTFEQLENLKACAEIFAALNDDFIQHIDASQTPEDIHSQVLALALESLAS